MEQLGHPLDWRAYGGHPGVVRQTGWSLPRARRQVRNTIKANGWNPIGHAGYLQLRRQFMNGDPLHTDLT
jgi:hypothetical protein